MIKIALMNQKGGTGKTTSVINIGGELVRKGKKVLIIDMDTQGNATSNIKIISNSNKNMADAIINSNVNINDVICHTIIDGLDIIQGGTLLGNAFVALQKMMMGRETVLKRLLNKLDIYDFVLFDCSPSLESILNINVLVATDYVLIPIRVDKNSIEGYGTMLETIKDAREMVNPDLKALGIFMTAVETGSSLDKEMKNEFPKMLPDLAFKTYIRKNIEVRKAPLTLQPLCFYNSKCAGSQDYLNLTNEILERLKAEGKL